MMNNKAVYWVVVIASSALLLWGWSLAIKNLVNGTTVQSGAVSPVPAQIHGPGRSGQGGSWSVV